MRRHRSDRLIGALTFVLMGVGLIVIYAIGPMRVNSLNAAYGSEMYEQYFFVHQLISVALATVAFVVAFKFPYLKLRKLGKWIMIAGLAACALLEICYLLKLPLAGLEQAEELGACRWFALGPVSLQPAELLKIGLILYLPQVVAECKRNGALDNWREFWLPVLVYGGLSLVFVVIVQKDLGTGVAILAIILAILFMSGMKMRRFLLVIAAVVVAGVLAIVMSPHRMERLMTFGGGGDSDSSYHIDNAMMAIGSGGLFGVGIGNSVQATGYLPESINDSVFAVMGETFGFVGLVAVLVAFAVILMRLLKTAGGLPTEPSLVVVGIFAWVMAHVVLNIAAMTGLIPLTGITLPLLSYGGTSLVTIMFGLGLACQLSCYTGREVKDENISSGRRLGGTHYTSRRRNS